ncbi:Hypp2848 [Branchiostoma lanceolatum]|uniref:Hypp2848 protein n=1 Tax=Branchiostoma lanceolatum TaxID=7740 RepID=A0A8K0EUS5_BRALA|nr:Hypp2848 [Branchiostoma lanceolatum]
MRPAEPQDLDFELANEYVPDDFLIGDIEVLWGRNQKARHLIFAIPYQLKLLSEARRLYMHGTFKVVREPFYQLFSIHAFLRSGDDIKQEMADYQAVLAHIKARLPTRAEMAECVVVRSVAIPATESDTTHDSLLIHGETGVMDTGGDVVADHTEEDLGQPVEDHGRRVEKGSPKLFVLRVNGSRFEQVSLDTVSGEDLKTDHANASSVVYIGWPRIGAGGLSSAHNAYQLSPIEEEARNCQEDTVQSELRKLKRICKGHTEPLRQERTLKKVIKAAKVTH